LLQQMTNLPEASIGWARTGMLRASSAGLRAVGNGYLVNIEYRALRELGAHDCLERVRLIARAAAGELGGADDCAVASIDAYLHGRHDDCVID
jgi:hypothetical protein